jgi:hypothetical protein
MTVSHSTHSDLCVIQMIQVTHSQMLIHEIFFSQYITRDLKTSGRVLGWYTSGMDEMEKISISWVHQIDQPTQPANGTKVMAANEAVNEQNGRVSSKLMV